jgi:hypothetical protein
MLNEYSGQITPIAGKLTNGTGRIRDRVIFCVPEKFFFRYFAKKNRRVRFYVTNSIMNLSFSFLFLLPGK